MSYLILRLRCLPAPITDRDRRHPCRKHSEVCVGQIVGAFAATCVDLDRSRLDQVAMGIEDAEEPGLIAPHIGLDPFERIFGYEKRSFHRAVVSPKPHSAPRRVKRPASIGEVQRHRHRSAGSKPPCSSHVRHSSSQRARTGEAHARWSSLSFAARSYCSCAFLMRYWGSPSVLTGSCRTTSYGPSAALRCGNPRLNLTRCPG
jgi:hypothetical protein